jgi:hypothetical protein
MSYFELVSNINSSSSFSRLYQRDLKLRNFNIIAAGIDIINKATIYNKFLSVGF